MPASQASALFDIVGEGAPVGLAFVDTELRFVRINAPLRRSTGGRSKQHVGRRIDEVLPELADALVPIYQHVLETGEPMLEREMCARRASSHVRHVLASWFPVRDDGEIMGVGAVVVDITDRKAAELRLQGVVQQLPVGVAIVDTDGRVSLGNHQLDEMGLRPQAGFGSHLGEPISRAGAPDGKPYLLAEYPVVRSLRKGEVVRGEEITYVREDGSRSARSRPTRRRSATAAWSSRAWR